MALLGSKVVQLQKFQMFYTF